VPRLACLLVVVVFTIGCGWVQSDEEAIRAFFAQSSLYDRTRLASVSRVAFDPRVEGVVTRFEIVSRQDTPMDAGRLRRVAQVDAVIRANGAMSSRTFSVTLEQAGSSWTITGYQ
jgi:hypothetical protein